MRPFRVRYYLAATIFAISIGLAISNQYAQIANQKAWNNIGFGAPAHRYGTFLEEILTLPGFLAGLPLIIAGIVVESNWFAEGGLILGAAMFWHCVGWYVDCARGAAAKEQPPKILVIHLRILMIASVILFPVGLLIGMKVGDYFCADGKPPFWADLLSYGIFMAWITLGVFFAWTKFRQMNKPGLPLLIFRSGT